MALRARGDGTIFMNVTDMTGRGHAAFAQIHGEGSERLSACIDSAEEIFLS
jgi:hypothetical protein